MRVCVCGSHVSCGDPYRTRAGGRAAKGADQSPDETLIDNAYHK